MKKLICFLAGSIVLLAFAAPPLHGRLVKATGIDNVDIAGLSVVVKQGQRVVYQTHADKNGHFVFNAEAEGLQGADIYSVGIGLDSLYIGSIKLAEHPSNEVELLVPAKIKRNLLGSVICPKCNKAGGVYKIVYGDGLPTLMKISVKGDTTYTAINKRRYNAGTCISGAARYFCNRDKIKF